MQIGIAGLGRIGAGMARRLARAGHDVVAWNRTESVATSLAAEPENGGHITVAEPLETLAARMAAPRHVMISVPSGEVTGDMIEQLAAILSPGDVIMTGTPEGVGLGMKPPQFLKTGDSIRCGVAGCGEQTHRVEAYGG